VQIEGGIGQKLIKNIKKISFLKKYLTQKKIVYKFFVADTIFCILYYRVTQHMAIERIPPLFFFEGFESAKRGNLQELL